MQTMHSLPSPIQAAFIPWNLIEKWLREATSHNQPISIQALYSLDDVKKAVRDKQQVRDIVTMFTEKKMVTKHDLPEEARTQNKRDRVGYMWNPAFKGESYRPSTRVVTKQAQKASKPLTHIQAVPVQKSAPETPKAIELEFQGVSIIIGRNPENGNLRLMIDSQNP